MTWILLVLYTLACIWAIVERFYRNNAENAIEVLSAENERLTKANESLSSEVEPLKKLMRHLHEQLTAAGVKNSMLQRKLKELETK